MYIITGTLAYDYIMDFPGKFADHILAGKEHSINLSFIVNKFAKRRGGTAGNVSYNLALLNTPHVLYSTAGKDFDDYKTSFDKLKINTKNIKFYKNEYTSTGFAVTDKKDNQIWGYFYGASDHIPELKLNKIAKKGDLVLIGPAGAQGSMSFVKQCITGGIEYMFDPGFILTQVSDEDLTAGVKNCTYLIGNDYEINLINSRVKNFDSIMKNKTLITTLGEKGALISRDGQKISIKSAKVKEVVDPTGAGDAWRAGFLTGLAKKYDLQTCGQIGAVISAYTVEQYGTQEHAFTKQQFTKRYKEAYNTTITI